jgi:methyltransferase (TIGR00027 family)
MAGQGHPGSPSVSLRGNCRLRRHPVIGQAVHLIGALRSTVRSGPTGGTSKCRIPWYPGATLPQHDAWAPSGTRPFGASLNYAPNGSLWSLTRSDVATTALFVAAVRARENERSNPLFQDQLSSALAGREGLAWLAASEASPSSNYHRDSFPYLEVRTRYFDDWTLQAVRDSKAQQLVLLGAGMDTRAFRLPWPEGFQFWEIDTPELFALKEARLRSAGVRLACDRLVVEADLTSGDWVDSLVDGGFKKNGSTVWLAEGLFQYLKGTDVDQILGGAASVSTPASRFGAEIVSAEFLRRNTKQERLRRRKDRGTPWVFGSDNPEELFRSHGWKVDGKVGALEVAVELGRWSAAHSGTAQVGPPGAFFVSATRASRTRSTVVRK